MKLSTIYKLALATTIVLSSIKCKKEFLNEKPNSSIVVPKTLDDFQALLDNLQVINLADPALPTLSADEYMYLDYSSWQAAATAQIRNAYIWSKDIFEGAQSDDWNNAYTKIYYANVILDGLNNLADSASADKKSNIKAAALYSRASGFFNLLQTFSPTYDSITSATDLGIPLRTSPDIDEILPRANVENSYLQTIKDLQESLENISVIDNSTNKNRVSKSAVYALMARLYLSMRKYNLAGKYADSALILSSTLLDYNTLRTTGNSPYNYLTNPEIIYIANQNSAQANTGNKPTILADTTLLNSYNENDLRRVIFFKQSPAGDWIFKNSYDGFSAAFSGLATDELYLIKSECYARQGNISIAIGELNTLLEKRWKEGTFEPIEPSMSQEEAIQLILNERRKELVFRNIRWSDIKRLNKEGANITLKRVLNGTTYELKPNSDLYVLPIPQNEITLGRLEQNNR